MRSEAKETVEVEGEASVEFHRAPNIDVKEAGNSTHSVKTESQNFYWSVLGGIV